MVVGDERTKSLDATGTYGHLETSTCLGTPQVTLAVLQACWPGRPWRVQIKNIKLHIVTDIKVNFNSMFGFRISNLVGGMGTFTKQEKNFSTPVDFLFHFRSRVTFVTSHTRCSKRCSQLSCRTKKPTAPGVPRRSPIQVLSWPDDA